MPPADDSSPRRERLTRGLDDQVLKAISHPLRLLLLARLNEGEASPKELASALGEPIGRVSHHVRVLSRIGAIELVRTEPRRGAVEHFYRAALRAYFSDEDWARMPMSTRRAVLAVALREILRDVGEAARGGGFDHPRAWASFVHLELDEAAMRELSELLDRTLARALEIGASASARVAAPEDRLATELALLHFERSGGSLE
jgi:DNA-binding transcriptional ArsR family regulator